MIMMMPANAPVKVALLVCVAVSGCGGGNDASTQELIRREQRRQNQDLFQPKSLQQRLKATKDYLANGNLDAARKEIRPTLISHPQDRDVIMLSAELEASSGNLIGAAEILKQVDNDDDDDVEFRRDALWLASEFLLEANEFDKAQQMLERILELAGDPTRAHRKLAAILNSQGRRIEAAKHLQALARSGKIREVELFAMNCYSTPFIDSSISKPDFGNRLLPAALGEAKILRGDDQADRARDLIETLSRAFPKSTQIWAFLGRIYEDYQEDESLRRWANSAPEGIDHEPEYWQTLGMWLQRQGRHREAVRCLSECVTRDPTDRLSCTALGRSLRVLGQPEVAKCVLDRAALLSESASIAAELGRRPGTREELSRMADILDQLGRSWEALGWRRVSLKMHGGTDAQTTRLQVRHESLQADTADDSNQRSEGLLACGIDLAQWPLPSLEGMAASDGISRHHQRFSQEPILLRDVAADVGLDFRYDSGAHPSDDEVFLHQLTGGGIGVIDFDLDGFCDLYMTQGGGPAFESGSSKPNVLFRNMAGQSFAQAPADADCGDPGYGQGVAVADINQDGFPDLVVANVGPNLVYLNNGDGSFARIELPRSAEDGSWTTSIACGDISGDHLPEIVEVNYVDDPSALTIPCTSEERESCIPLRFQPAADFVWRVGPDMSISSWKGCNEMESKPSYGFASVIGNINAAVGNELFIVNDGKANHLWVSQPNQDGTSRKLTESARLYGCDVGPHGLFPGCMGIASGDFDRNGALDFHVTNFWDQPADLYLQDSSGLFSNAAVSHGIARHTVQTVGWGTQAIDFNRDGWLDIVVLNGHVQDLRDVGHAFKMRAQLFHGGPDGFGVAASKPNEYWNRRSLGRTLASLDWNADRRPDLVANYLDAPVTLLENQSQPGNSLQLELVGTTSERDAIGAKVVVTCQDQSWTRWVVGGDGFLCSNEHVVDFGLGDAKNIDRIEVHWPTGKIQEFGDLTADSRYLIVEGDDEVWPRVIR